MRKTLVLLMIAALIIAALATACSSGGGGAEQKAETSSGQGNQQAAAKEGGQNKAGDNAPYTLKVRTPTGFSAHFIAEEKGFLAEQNLKIEYIGALNIPDRIPAVLSGATDLEDAQHMNAEISAIVAGAPIKVVMGTTESTEELPHMTYWVLKDSPIKTAADLKGKKVAVGGRGTCADYFVNEYMRQNGQDPTSVEFVLLPDPQQQQMLDNGAIDVAGTHTGSDAKFWASSNYRPLFTDYDLEPQGQLGTAGLIFSTDFLEKHPGVVKRYVAAMAKTYDWINANRDEALKMGAARLKMDPKLVMSQNYPAHGLVKESVVKSWLPILDKEEKIATVDVAKVYTNEFNPHH